MPRGILTPEQRKKQLEGINNPLNRRKLSEKALLMWRTKDMTERNKKVSESRKGVKHPLWKENPSYESLHEWINNNKPKPILCGECHKEKKLEAANISGLYKRDLDDWEWLCRKCHMIKDGRMKKLIESNKKICQEI